MNQYTITPGDTLWAIAQQHGISLSALEAPNPGLDALTLQVGQVIHLPAGPGGKVPRSKGSYVQYQGPASNFPNPSQWAGWDTLWSANTRLIKYNASDAEVEMIRGSIQQVSNESGVDARVILVIIVQESGGNPRVPTTNNGVRNPGLMQSHNGVEFSPNNPAESILQMIRDGTSGTQYGDGLKQLYDQYRNWYEAFRGYNSGDVNKNELNDPMGATGSYVRDVANRLMEHEWENM